MDAVIEFFSTLPHCTLYGRPWLAATHLTGSAMIFIAYMLIPIAIEIVRRKRQIAFSPLAALFAGFIFLCGMGHLLKIFSDLTALEWVYWVRSVNDCLTGIVSLATAVVLFRMIPTLLTLPTKSDLEFAKETIEVYRDLYRWRQMGKPTPSAQPETAPRWARRSRPRVEG